MKRDHLHTSRVRSGFNFLAHFYDLFSFLFLGRAILRSQTHFLLQLKKCDSVLIFGGGTGKILAALLEKETGINYSYVDISDGMNAIAKRRILGYHEWSKKAANGQIQFITGTYENIPARHFDLIITTYVLDCFTEEELPTAMDALHEKLLPGGQWLFADFNVPQKGLMNYFSKAIIRMLYFFFNLTAKIGVKKLPCFEKQFARLGYKKEKEAFFRKGLLTAKLYVRP